MSIFQTAKIQKIPHPHNYPKFTLLVRDNIAKHLQAGFDGVAGARFDFDEDFAYVFAYYAYGHQ